MHATSPFTSSILGGCNKSVMRRSRSARYPRPPEITGNMFFLQPLTLQVRRTTARYILKSKWNEKAGLLGPGRVVRITEKVTSNLPHNQVDFFFFVFVSPVHCLSFLLPVTAISHSGDTCCIS